MSTRRQLIEKVWAEVDKGPPVSQPPKGATRWDRMGHALRTEHKAGNIKPLGLATMLANNCNKADLPYLDSLTTSIDELYDLGKYGNRDKIASLHGMDRDMLDMVMEHAEIDEVTSELIERRGNDSTRPLEPLNRRDYLSAAFDAHSTSEE